MYAVGSFTSIKRFSTVYARNNAFSFAATSPFTVTSWNPNVNGIVNSIAFNADCSVAYLGGKFTSVERHRGEEHRRGLDHHRRGDHHVRAQRRPARWRPCSGWAATC